MTLPSSEETEYVSNVITNAYNEHKLRGSSLTVVRYYQSLYENGQVSEVFMLYQIVRHIGLNDFYGIYPTTLPASLSEAVPSYAPNLASKYLKASESPSPSASGNVEPSPSPSSTTYPSVSSTALATPSSSPTPSLYSSPSPTPSPSPSSDEFFIPSSTPTPTPSASPSGEVIILAPEA